MCILFLTFLMQLRSHINLNWKVRHASFLLSIIGTETPAAVADSKQLLSFPDTSHGW